MVNRMKGMNAVCNHDHASILGWWVYSGHGDNDFEKMILEIEIPLSGGSIFLAKIADFFGFFRVEILTEEKEYTWEVGV